MAAPTTVEDYLAVLPAERRAVMEHLRRTIRAAAPDAVESIAYSMPAFRTPRGTFLVSYAAYKRHYSLFPANATIVAALGEEVRPFLAGKATLQFPSGGAIPMTLVTRLVKVRLDEVRDHADR
jgi:uncharacterized protein YdhG (YjbR/CyaY superfamily)